MYTWKSGTVSVEEIVGTTGGHEDQWPRSKEKWSSEGPKLRVRAWPFHAMLDEYASRD